jgi:uncharacterized protein YndB with AHSA1/START domain
MDGTVETGVLEPRDGRWMLRYERRLRHAPEKVWRALTDPGELMHWFPSAIEGERRKGAPLRFVFPGGLAPGGDGAYRVFDPPRVLEFTWNGDVLRWELAPHPAGCVLRFTYTFDDRSVAARNGSGWDLCIARMTAHLDGTEPPDMGTWPVGYARYMARFGLGDFPGFMQAVTTVPGLSEHTPGLECTSFTGNGGRRLVLCRATWDAETAEHAYDGDSYLLVAEGNYLLRFRGGEMTLKAGMEFHIPDGLRHSGHITEGTRLVVALAAKPT